MFYALGQEKHLNTTTSEMLKRYINTTSIWRNFVIFAFGFRKFNMKKAGRILLKVLLWFFGLSILWVIITKYVPVVYTPLMLSRAFEYAGDDKVGGFRRQWKPIEEIDHDMVQAVVASEDNLFMTHNGFDWESIKKAAEYNSSNKKNKVRGGSTISQQTAKNVFTFGTHTYFRKAVEAYYTFLIELIWGKERIMEVYLNIVETGANIYGVEAASQCYYHHSAKKMTPFEAAKIAAVLPSPRKYRVVNPGPYVIRRSTQITILMKKIGKVEFE